MITSQNQKGPSIAELQEYIRDKVRLEFLLNNGDRYIGRLRWFDEFVFSLDPDKKEQGQPLTLLRAAVAGYRPVSK